MSLLIAGEIVLDLLQVGNSPKNNGGDLRQKGDAEALRLLARDACLTTVTGVFP
jgi:hypothetical protein